VCGYLTPADEDAAEVIRNIYSLFLGGMSKNAIVHHLNGQGVLSPSAYKRNKGMVYKTPSVAGTPMWGTKVIHDILSNRLYIGDLVQGRRRVKSYKIHTIEAVPEEDWVIVENTHEPIIDKKIFQKAQELLKRDTRTAPKEKRLYLFSGFLRCADCGKSVNRYDSNGNIYYRCSTYAQRSRTACTKHTIKHNRLEMAVQYAIQQQVYLAVSYSDMVSRINTAPLKKSQSARIDSLIAEKEKELAKITRYKQAAFENWQDGNISHSDYRHMREDYERQAQTISTIIYNLNAEQAEVENGINVENPFLVAFSKYENIDKLTREILIELVDHIKIYEGGDISIKFKLADEYRRVAEYIEVNTKKQAV